MNTKNIQHAIIDEEQMENYKKKIDSLIKNISQSHTLLNNALNSMSINDYIMIYQYLCNIRNSLLGVYQLDDRVEYIGTIPCIDVILSLIATINYILVSYFNIINESESLYMLEIYQTYINEANQQTKKLNEFIKTHMQAIAIAKNLKLEINNATNTKN